MQKNTVLIVEPRIIDYLPNVINECHCQLGDNWNYVFYCGKSTIQYWTNKLGNFIELRPLDVDNFPNPNEYNDFFKTRGLWTSLTGGFVLTIQADTWITNTKPYDIDFFINLNKSYIGGNMMYPWFELNREHMHFEYFNFNGGLSLRNRLDMIKIIDTFPPEPTAPSNSQKHETDPEDVYFTIGCYKLGLKLGVDEASSHFAMHTIIKDAFFGIHQSNEITRSYINAKYPLLKYANPVLKLDKIYDEGFDLSKLQ